MLEVAVSMEMFKPAKIRLFNEQQISENTMWDTGVAHWVEQAIHML